jgi:hypothetical protein
MTGTSGLRISRRAAGAAAALLAVAGVLGAGVASAGAAGAATRAESTAPAAAVPWGSVGAGWVLTEYSTATRTKPEPETLYLISPGGTKYSIYRWKSAASALGLVAWAGNKMQALLGSAVSTSATYDELNLRTGKLTAVTLAGKALALGYTLPTGQQILAETNNVFGTAEANITLARYTQAGKLVKKLVTEKAYNLSAVYSPNGEALGVSAASGLLLVSNAGGSPKELRVPGVQPVLGCTPERWWNASTILASCYPKNSGEPQLWLVPASGAKPSALTPVRTTGEDLGDINAWQLSSGLYLQSLGPCGTFEINKQAKNGSVTMVTVPGTVNSPVVVTASSSRLLVQTLGCAGGGQLVWFNPATRAEQWLFKTGDLESIAYTNEENGGLSG